MNLPRLYPILDTVTLAARGLSPVSVAGEMIRGGATILQYRHKGFFSRECFEEASRIAELCAAHKVVFVVDDRADIARLLAAACHVGQDDLPSAEARRILGPDLALGFSTHNRSQLLAGNTEPVDYLALGPVFATGSKENPDPVLGLDLFGKLASLAAFPLVAIGGITLETARPVIDAGAASVAVISALLPDPGEPAAGIARRVQQWLEVLG